MLWLDAVGSVRRLSACVPLPPSGFLLLLSPWEEVQLIGGGRRRLVLIPLDSNTWRGGATRAQQPTMAIDITEVSGENGLDLLSSAAEAVWFARFDPNQNAESQTVNSQTSFTALFKRSFLSK